MEYLFDTNIFGELRRPDLMDPKALEFLSAIPSDRTYLSAISLLEMETSVLRIERKDPSQGIILRQWLDAILAFYDGSRILVVDADIARRCAAKHVPNPRSYYDGLIAATAEHHGMTIVTRNDRDFSDASIPVVNPWKS